MDVANRSKGQLKRSFDTKIAEIDAAIVNGTTTVLQLKTLLAQLEQRWRGLAAVYDEIQQLLEQANEDADTTARMDAEYIEKERLQDEFLRARVTAEEKIVEIELLRQAAAAPQNNARTAQSTPAVGIKLPTLELKSFSGDLMEWRGFWESFNDAVNNNAQLRDEQKFNYLIGVLKGDALKEVECLSLTAASYAKALDILQQRYSRPEMIIQAHMNELCQLKDVRNVTDTASLRRLYNNVNIHVRELEAMGKPVDSFGGLLVTTLLRKIPYDMRLAWSRDSSRSATDLEAFLTFIRNELTARDCCDLLKPLKCSEENPGDKRYKNVKQTAATLTANATVEDSTKGGPPPCLFCNSKDHRSAKCPCSLEERKAALKRTWRCFICTKRNHKAENCQEAQRCLNCQGNHHVFICHNVKKPAAPEQAKKEKTPEARNGGNSLVATSSAANDDALFMTGLVRVFGHKGIKMARIVIDTCSKLSYITSELADIVGLDVVGKERLQITGFGGKVTRKTMNRLRVDLGVRDEDDPIISLDVFETTVICDEIPQPDASEYLQQLQRSNLTLADDVDNLEVGRWSGNVDILIGARHAARVITGNSKRLSPEILAIETIFGWVVMGGAVGSMEGNTSQIALMSVVDNDRIEDTFIRRLPELWELDNIGIRDESTVSIELNPTVLEFESEIKMESGRYYVKLPFKLSHSELPDNLILASNRARGLIKRLRRKPELLKNYHKQIEEYLELGFIEEVESSATEASENVHYLPHHPVVRQDKQSTKVRPVFDASAGSPSLNDCLETGPNMTPHLIEILIRFRLRPIVVTADVEKAFLQIRVNPEHRDYLRFLWSDDPFEENRSLKHYRWKTVVFGVTSSPFLLAATVRHHVQGFKEAQPEAATALLEDMYVDDVISGADGINEAEKLALNTTEIMKKAGFNLRRWSSNDAKLQENLNSLQHEAELDDRLQFAEPQSKVLGLAWIKSGDFLTYETQEIVDYCKSMITMCTKRVILSAASRIFDPLGLICPVTIRPKIIIQQLWQQGLGWDDEVSTDTRRIWSEWTKSIEALTSLRIPRYYCASANSRPKSLELHMFSDASEKAYGTVAYLRFIDDSGKILVQIVAGRARVAPLKRVTLPRLELLGCVLSARLAVFVRNALKMKDMKTFYWTDSTVALNWVRSQPQKWKTFVANRVQSIHLSSSPEDWRFVVGRDNPADLCSRGADASALVNDKIWWNGPEWLSFSSDKWPSQPYKQLKHQPEMKIEERVHAVAANVRVEAKTIVKASRYGGLSVLLRHTAYILRAFRNVLATFFEQENKGGALDAQEIQLAKEYWFRQLQLTYFAEEISQLKRNGIVQSSSRLSKFQPFISGKDGIMRLKGRVRGSMSAKFVADLPLLPSESFGDRRTMPHFVILLIRSTHERLMHAGVKDTLDELRQSCWILQGRRAVKAIIRSCVVCTKERTKPYVQTTAPLPLDRSSPSAPFSVVGIDFAGPLFLHGSEGKSWICLFTCASTRAIHLELVLSLSVASFMMAFHRFISRRGICSTIYSDNAKTFKRASKDLKTLMNDQKIAKKFAEVGVTWKFIVEGAPWWGGFYERLVGITKALLRKTIGSASLRAEELETLMIRAEAIINSRPLTYQYEEHNEPRPISPSDILIGRRFTSLPIATGVVEYTNTTKSEICKQVRCRERLASQFWESWRKEYLQERNLQFRRDGQITVVKVGEVVLIKEDHTKRRDWKIAVVKELYQGRDGVVRAVRLKTATGELRRPVQRLCSLEFTEDEETNAAVNEVVNDAENALEPMDTAPSTRGEDVAAAATSRFGRRLRPPQRFSY